MACSVFHDPIAQGEGTLKCVLVLLNGTPIDGMTDNYYNIRSQLISAKNVDYFMKQAQKKLVSKQKRAFSMHMSHCPLFPLMLSKYCLRYWIGGKPTVLLNMALK